MVDRFGVEIKNEKRKDQRTLVDIPSYINGGISIIKDLSLSGVGADVMTVPDRNNVTIHFTQGIINMSIPAKIVNIMDDPKDGLCRYKIGLSLEGLTKQQEEFLCGYIMKRNGVNCG